MTKFQIKALDSFHPAAANLTFRKVLTKADHIKACNSVRLVFVVK